MQKFYSRLTGFMMLSLLLAPFAQRKVYAQDAVVSYQTFYDNLSPFGQWVDDPTYGNVWVPNVEPGFRPYASDGHWVMTDYGNMWVSDEPWGWAAYHYGRWTYSSYYGWIWVPGHEWAPAWVSWRSGGGYYGWAPMGPGYYPGQYYEYPENYWVFVGPEYLYRPNVYTYYEPRYSRMYMRRTEYISETYVDNGSHVSYYYGPRRESIERESGQPVPVYHISNSNAPGAAMVGGNSVSIYRPAVNRESVSAARPANVVPASQPIGKPERYDPGHNHAEFRQQVQTQNNSGNNHNFQNNQNQNRVEPANNQFNNRQEQQGGNHFQQTQQPYNRQLQQTEQQNRQQQNEQQNRQQPERNEPPRTEPPVQQHQQPMQQQQRQQPQRQPKPQRNPPPRQEKRK